LQSISCHHCEVSEQSWEDMHTLLLFPPQRYKSRIISKMKQNHFC
jgi:hypothetical protein